MANTTNSLKREKDFLDKYNSCSSLREQLNSAWGTNFVSARKSTRAKAANGELSSEWSSLRQRAKEVCECKARPVPHDASKSDFYFMTSRGDEVGVSYKNGSGRPTSANFKETYSLFWSVLNKHFADANNRHLRQKVVNFFALWAPLGARTYHPQSVTVGKVKKGLCEHKGLQDRVSHNSGVLNPEINKLVAEEPEFMTEVIREALVGELKYGDNLQKASYLIETKKDSLTEFKEILDVKTDKFTDYSREQMTKINFGMKGSGNSILRPYSWIRFC